MPSSILTAGQAVETTGNQLELILETARCHRAEIREMPSSILTIGQEAETADNQLEFILETARCHRAEI
jgi:hypothetical protein